MGGINLFCERNKLRTNKFWIWSKNWWIKYPFSHFRNSSNPVWERDHLPYIEARYAELKNKIQNNQFVQSFKFKYMYVKEGVYTLILKLVCILFQTFILQTDSSLVLQLEIEKLRIFGIIPISNLILRKRKLDFKFE